MIQVYFKPNKKWYQVWERNRFLKENKEYTIEGGILKTHKQFNGKLTVEYQTN